MNRLVVLGLLALVVLGIASPVAAASAVTSTSAGINLEGSTTPITTATITTPASNPLVLFAVHLSSTTATVTSIVASAGLGGGTATQIVALRETGGAATGYVVWFCLVAPTPSGSGTAAITLSAAVPWHYSWIVVSGADQTTPCPTGANNVDSAQVDGPTSSKVFTLSNIAAGDMIVGAGSNTSGNPAAPSGTGITQSYLDDTNSVNASAGYGSAGTTAITINWDGGGVGVGAALRVAAAAGGASNKAGGLVDTPILKGLVGGGLAR
jgi:hypothetical protein